MMRELSASKPTSTQNSVGRNSIDNDSTDMCEASPFIPSARISLEKEESPFSKSINTSFATHTRTRTSNPVPKQHEMQYKSATQKYSFYEKTPAKAFKTS